MITNGYMDRGRLVVMPVIDSPAFGPHIDATHGGLRWFVMGLADAAQTPEISGPAPLVRGTGDFDFYRDVLSDVCELSRTNDRPFHSDITATKIGDSLMHWGSNSASIYRRERSHVRRDGYDDIVIAHTLAGRGVYAIDGAEKWIRSGDTYVIERNRTYACKALTDIGTINLNVPRHLLDAIGVNLNEVHGSLLNGPVMSLLIQNLFALSKQPEMASPHFDSAMIHLLAAAFGIKGEGGFAAVSRLKQKVASLIESRIGDSELSTAAICIAVGTSRSALYRAFAADGGVHAFIRDRRLRLARQRLAQGEARIGEIAWDLGFGSPGAFSTIFRKHYGVAPREVARHEGRDPSNLRLLDYNLRLQRWNAVFAHSQSAA